MPNQTEKSQETRRSFVQTGAVAIAGLGLAGSGFARPAETLAQNGGSKAVTFPAERLEELTQWPRYGQEEKDALIDMINSKHYYAQIPPFENEWQAFTKSKYVCSHNNGTSALTSMYFAMDLPPGSEVMVPSHTFLSTVITMRLFGLVPIFIDIDPRTANFDVDYAAKHLTPRTKAIVVVHRNGLPCEMDRIEEFAKKHGLILTEDAAHAQGATMQGKRMGTWGVMGMTSFQESKPMPGLEGGMGMYQTREYYERAYAWGHWDLLDTFPDDSPYKKYSYTGLGQKYRIHPFAVAVLRKRLVHLDDLNAAMRRRVSSLNDRLKELPGISEPPVRADQTRIYYGGSPLLFDEKKAGFSKAAAVKALQAEGVKVGAGRAIQEQHVLPVYSEAKWWHHPPKIPQVLPGHVELAKIHMGLPLLHEDAPELVEQYVAAFKKVWAHKEELAKA